MRWYEMTGPEVGEFAATTDLALAPIGCVEMHGPHLPTGSDGFIATEVCDRIAAEVSCVVLPPLFYNINASMKSYPGTISIPADVMVQLYDAIFRECARNGFKKIFAVICHGGSETPVQFLANLVHERATLKAPDERARPEYYLFSKTISLARAREFAKSADGQFGHACEIETGLNLAARPDLVKLEKATETGERNPRAVSANYHIDWIREVPRGYIGEPWLATPDSGERFMQAVVQDFLETAKRIAAYDPERDV